MKLFISTFGGFDIKEAEKSLLKESKRTYKLYKLFQYFLTFRNKKILPETIIDNIWSDSESDDPKNVLRTQIFRLRQVIKSFLPIGEDEEDYITINFINGYYCLEIGENITLDLDEFESLIYQGDNERTKDIENAISWYNKAIKIYKGQYLSGNAYEVWLVPTRNYYHRLYLKTLYKLIEILKEKQRYEEIISLSEESLLIEPFEEEIHIKLIEAMLKLGQYKDAMSHFDYTSFLLEKEMEVKPSEKFTELLRKIQDNSSANGEIDIFNIKKKLDDFSKEDVMHCDFDYFKFLFNIQKKKSLRNNENDFFGFITLSGNQKNNSYSNEICSWSKYMTEILLKSLRKGDVFTFWNDKQILIMLHDIKGDGINIVKDRIQINMRDYMNGYSYNMTITFLPLISDDILI